jgi:hypothetical protein
VIARMKAKGFRCSFCDKEQGEVAKIMTGTPQRMAGVPRKMIGKSAFICDECVRRYYQIVTGAEVSQTPMVAPK